MFLDEIDKRELLSDYFVDEKEIILSFLEIKVDNHLNFLISVKSLGRDILPNYVAVLDNLIKNNKSFLNAAFMKDFLNITGDK